MLLEVSIKNFALIDDVNIKFDKGLNVIMGETGSGKSNIIDSISVLLGGRAQKDKIRKDSEKAIISAAFDVNNDELLTILKDNGLYIEDEPIIVTREINLNSNTISKINNTMVSVSLLKEISKYLIDIYGQFENITILSKSEQLNFIDQFGDLKHLDNLNNYQGIYENMLQIKSELENFERSPEQVKRDIDFLNFQIEEIESSSVLEIDEDNLERELSFIENSQELRDYTLKILNLLSNDENDVLTSLGRISNYSENLSSIDKDFEDILNRFNQVLIETEDIKSEIISYNDKLEFDEELYSKLDDKRNILYTMKRKYGNSLDEINKYYENSKYQLDELSNYESTIEKKLYELNKLELDLIELSDMISIKRKEISKELIGKIKYQLKELDMKDSDFDIIFNDISLNSKGKDEVMFMVSFNKNEPLKVFSEVASGGEISRFMLSVKSIEAENEKIPTIIFDEIDTGISGNAGNVVGNKLKNLSKEHQLICISHLPQIISKGDSQYLVYKDVINDKMTSNIIKLNYEERIKHLAKVIEGDNYNEHTFNTAKKMIDDNLRGEL